MRRCKYALRFWDEPPGLLVATLRPPEENLPESGDTGGLAWPLSYISQKIPLGPILSLVSVTAALYPRPMHSPQFSPSFHMSPACPCVVSSSKVNGSKEGSPPLSSASMRRGSGSEDSQTSRYRERGCRLGALSLMPTRRSVSVPVPVCGG